MLDAYEFTKKTGIIKEGDYPDRYNGRKNSCRDPKEKSRVKNDD